MDDNTICGDVDPALAGLQSPLQCFLVANACATLEIVVVTASHHSACCVRWLTSRPMVGRMRLTGILHCNHELDDVFGLIIALPASPVFLFLVLNEEFAQQDPRSPRQFIEFEAKRRNRRLATETS